MMGLIILILFYCMYTICFIVSRSFLLKIAKVISYFLALIPIAAVERNIKVIRAFQISKGIEPRSVRALKLDYFYYLLKNIIDFFKFLVIDPEGFYEILDMDPEFDSFLDDYNGKQGIVFIGMHLGNWELGPLVGFKNQVKMCSLAFHQISPVLEQLLSSLRRRYGVTLLHQRKGMKEAIQRLNKGEVLIFLGDQDGTKSGNFQKFCGMTSSFPRGIELFVKKTQAKVRPVVLVHEGDNYKLIVEPEIVCDKNRESLDFQSLHEQLADFYEKFILLYPEQWLLVYDRFKLRHNQHLEKIDLLDQVKKEHKEIFEA